MTHRSARTTRLLSQLEKIRGSFGPGVAVRKHRLLEELSQASFSSQSRRAAGLLLRTHENLLFLSAYPDDPEIFHRVQRELGRLHRRMTKSVVRRLEDSGIEGTSLSYSFDFPNAAWLADRCPRDTEVAWDDAADEALQKNLAILAGPMEELGIDDEDTATRAWIRLAAKPGSALGWVVNRLNRLKIPPRLRDHLYDAMNLSVCWNIRGGTWSRTSARLPDGPVYFHDQPLVRGVADVVAEVRRPLTVAPLERRRARAILDLAKAALIARHREMYPITHGNPADVSLYSLERGLSIATIGTLPERRLALESLWGFLLLKNGLPVGYGSFSVLFGAAEIAANIFDTFRQGESAWIYTQLLRVIHHHTGAGSFSVMNAQLGHGDEEAIKSGAFWFYYKLGFRPASPRQLRRVEAERERIRRRPGYRSSPRMLRTLAQEHVHFSLDHRRRPLPGTVAYARIGLDLTRRIADQRGADREHAVRDARHMMTGLLGKSPSRSEWSDEMVLVASLLEREIRTWSRAERTALAALIAAKSSVSEVEFARLGEQHRRWREGILRLARRGFQG